MSEHASDDALNRPPANAAPAEDAERRDADARALAESGLGSGLLTRQSVSSDEGSVPVFKVCPQCGTEYETALRFCPNDGTALRPKGTDSLVGRVLADRYHILKPIGEGGMGRVYLGEHVKMNRQCAIKVMSPALVNDSESAARFAREASNAARIIHPNVAAVFDYGESDGVVYLVMEYVDGEPLSDLIVREAPFTIERALNLTSQITEGLSAAHELGIIHRDLKPDNILITRTRTGREVAKVVDFGIAKAIQGGAGDALTRTGLVIGTPEYMSPEQLLGDPIDARSDLYALGCILHLMLTATPPFEATTREQMIKRRLSEDARPIHTLDPAIPIGVSAIVSRLLSRSAKDRYGSAAELRDDIAATHSRKAGPGSMVPRGFRPTPRSAPTVAFLHATQATTEVTLVPVPKSGRRAPLVIAGAVLLTLGIGFVVMRRESAARDLERVRVARDSVRRDSAARAIAAARADSAAVPRDSAAVATALVSDSLKTAELTQQRARDSIARAAIADTTIVRKAVADYAKVLESGDIARVRAAYPVISADLQRYWMAIFADAEKVSVGVRYGQTVLSSTGADVHFTLQVKVNKKATDSVTLPRREQEMKMTRAGTRTQVTELR